MRSQTRPLNIGPAGNPVFLQLVDHVDARVIPRTVRIKSALMDPTLDSDEKQAAAAQGLIAGLWWAKEATGNAWNQPGDRLGALRLRFGSQGGIFREVFADLREGEYNLPPCDSVQVAAAYWRATPEQTGNDLLVSVEVADGETVESTPLIVTAAADIRMDQPGIDFGSIPGARTCQVPPGAYAMDARAGDTGVVVYQYPGTGYGPPTLRIERDEAEGRWLPPTTPVLLGRANRLVVHPVRAPSSGNVWAPELTFFVR